MPAQLLAVENLTIQAGSSIIIDNLSFSIQAGEIVALTGKSGSGKTSVANAILGFLPPGIQMKRGTISWTGLQGPLTLPQDQQQWRSLRGSHIGYTQQDVFGTFDPILRMGKQMMMIVTERSSQSTGSLEQTLRLRMEEVGLHDIVRLWNSYPHQLSGGQLQRCLLCMAIVIGPQLIISDEPTSAIDKINQLELLDLFAMLRDKFGMAILCITHEEAVVNYLADREIRIDGSSDALRTQNDSPLVTGSGEQVVMEGRQLVYKHRYGGMLHKEGAVVGPLSFMLYQRRCLGIIGESGSGKSTLAQLMVGLLLADSGSIWLNNNEVQLDNPVDRHLLRSKVQLVMQDGRGSLHPEFTIRQILGEVPALSKQKREARSATLEHILREVNLDKSILDRKPDTLSGGECLRVSIARALLMAPEVLILDESSSALDSQNRDAILLLLKRLMNDHQLALLFISHDGHIMQTLSDTLMVLADGKVVEAGSTAEVSRYPTHPITKKIFSTHATLAHKRDL